jgi:hypothetical protein
MVMKEWLCAPELRVDLAVAVVGCLQLKLPQ